jgi:hypothetical protein
MMFMYSTLTVIDGARYRLTVTSLAHVVDTLQISSKVNSTFSEEMIVSSHSTMSGFYPLEFRFQSPP